MTIASLVPIMVSLTGQALPADGPLLIDIKPWEPQINGQSNARMQADTGEPLPPPPPENWQELINADPATGTYSPPPAPSNDNQVDGRRRPGYEAPLPDQVVQDNPGAVRPPPPEAFPTDQVPIPDRWRLIQSLGVVKERWFDPYHQNTWKGDRPVRIPFTKGDDWFVAVSAVSDTVIEPRTFPIPVGIQYPQRPGSNDVFGKDSSFVASQTLLFGVSVIKGLTAFKPPDVEYRVTLALNGNYAKVPERRILYIQPDKGRTRTDHFLGVQELFFDYHIRNVTDRYDFDSFRIGIQPFQADFRGFLFNDNQLGLRLFGNRDNNRFQYNVAAFWRLEKDTNSGLNTLNRRPRRDFVFLANLYRQDFLIPGLTSELIFAYNANRENDRVYVDDNGFPVRPALIGNLGFRKYDVVYLGYAVDGRIGRLNLTATAYAALGKEKNNVFTGRPARIRSFFAAGELSYDIDWARFRLSGLYASADKDPFDDRNTGFDAIFENPVFAGADTSYWIRQAVPFIGGGRAVGLTGRNGILNSLRSSKEEGQSNFINPGTQLVGAGTDLDLTPQFRLSLNANHLWFGNTKVLQTLRSQGSVKKDIGWDLSAAAVYRPKANQNIVFRLSGAALMPGKGFKSLFTNVDRNRRYYSVLANMILSY